MGYATPMDAHRGWHTRGYLPHIDAPVAQFLTWRLADAVPEAVIESWKLELASETDTERIKKLNRQIEAYADAGHGSCVLRDPRAARIVQESLFHGHRSQYDLLSWVVMPNHVHAVLTPCPGVRLGRIVQALKGVTSKRIGALLGLEGRLWQPDYFDRVVRDDGHRDRLARYLEWNPVKAGLCDDPKHWAWSSASPNAQARLTTLADQGSGHL